MSPNCTGWTVDLGTQGTRGLWTGADATWTTSLPNINCSQSMALYCLEQ